jgi:hypothetical protein
MAWVGEGALSVVRSDDVDRNDNIFGMVVRCNMSTYECALACALCKMVRSRRKCGGNTRGEQASKHCPCSIVVDNGSGRPFDNNTNLTADQN